MGGLLFFAPVTSRVSPRRASYFFLLRQKKVTKKKASHVRAASRSLALLAAFGTLANSLRSNSASVLIRTLLRCSARPNGGGIPHGSSASRTSPRLLVRCAHIAQCWGCLIPLPSLLSRARHAVPLRQTPSFLIPHSSRLTSHHGQPQGLPLRSSLLTPTTSLLTPHSYDLTPHSYDLTPHSYDLTPHSYDLTPHSYDLTPHSSGGKAVQWRVPWGEISKLDSRSSSSSSSFLLCAQNRRSGMALPMPGRKPLARQRSR